MYVDQFNESIEKLFTESYKEEIEKMEKRLAEIKKIYRNKKKKVLKEIEADPSVIDRYMEEKLKAEQKAKIEEKLYLEAKLKEEEKKKKVEFEEKKSVLKSDMTDKNENKIENQGKALNKEEINIKQEVNNQLQILPTQPPAKSIGGNPMNPQVALQKQLDTEKEHPKPFQTPSSTLAPPSSNPTVKNTSTSQITPDIPIELLPTKDPEPSAKPQKPPAPSEPKAQPAPPLLLPKEQYLRDIFETSHEITVLYREKMRIADQISKIRRKLDNPALVKEEGLQHIKIDHPDQFRQKTKGFAVPFNTVDKDDKVSCQAEENH